MLSVQTDLDAYYQTLSPPLYSDIPSHELTGAWPFLVGGVICLVNSVNERDPSLLNNSVNDLSLAAVS